MKLQMTRAEHVAGRYFVCLKLNQDPMSHLKIALNDVI